MGKTTHELVGGDLAKLGEDLLQLLVRQVLAKVLHINICELLHLRFIFYVLCPAVIEHHLIEIKSEQHLLPHLFLPFLSGHKSTDKHLLLVQQHSIHLQKGVSSLYLITYFNPNLLDGIVRSLLSLKMNEAISFRSPIIFCRHFAAQNVPKGRECVIHRLVIDRPVQVLYEHIANTAPPEGRVTLAPHDTDGTSLEHVKVHRVEGTFS